MSRTAFIRSSEHTYHVTARMIKRVDFPLPIEETWELFSSLIYFITFAYQVRVLSFVLMSNHYHLLIRAPRGNLPEAQNYLQREASRQFNRQTCSIDQNFGGPYSWTLIDDDSYLAAAYRYVYRNPVEAGLSKRVEDYKYSTLHGLLGKSRLLIPTESIEELFLTPQQHLNWLNEAYDRPETKAAIQKALRRRIFKIPRMPNGHRLT